MAKFLILGAGQLGSRHLQALTQLPFKAEIWVVDPGDQALVTAQQRYKEACAAGDPGHHLLFQNNLTGLPKALDAAVIATNADIRRAVLEQLLDYSDVRFLVLEKVLFQKTEDYERCSRILTEHGAQAWVNCPRRQWPSYQKLREQLSGPVSVEVVGEQWGIGCNGIHFIDLCAYLGQDPLPVGAWAGLDGDWLESKRQGFLEFSGQLDISFARGSRVSMKSLAYHKGPATVTVSDRHLSFEICEAEAYMLVTDPSQRLQQRHDFAICYQSQLTASVLDDLMQTGRCALTPYEESKAQHLIMLNAFSDHLAKTTNAYHSYCPIT